jgi:hypothetical protein
MMPVVPIECVDAWDLFQAGNTQWRTSFGGVVGLDYCAFFHISETLGIEITEDTLKYLKMIERCYLELQSEMSDKE